MSAVKADALRFRPDAIVFWTATGLLLVAIFWEAGNELMYLYNVRDSYYSHGPLVPLVSLYFVYRQRDQLKAIPASPNHAVGIGLLVAACLMVLTGDLLGFRIVPQLAMLVMVMGLLVSFWGVARVRCLWFPIAFLLFMIPIPQSITQAQSLHLKLLASEGAVRMAQFSQLPVIRDGSFIMFPDDRLLVGEVCGGLRSLIALLALGAIVSYISGAAAWARVALFAIAGPVAIFANMLRIFFLCVVTHFWGSETASGRVHDLSGILIYATAIGILMTAEYAFRRVAPPKALRDARLPA